MPTISSYSSRPSETYPPTGSSLAIQSRVRRILFLLALIFGASIFWFAKHPPMGDLAQHAGQVTLLRDLISGSTPWADLVRINLATPYLVGYGLALPLSFIFPIDIALKILLSCAYVCFVLMSIKVRVYLRGDPRLDWLFLPGFFGFAMGWGFLTFLVAAPLAVAMIYVSDLHARRVTIKSSLAVFLVGLLLLMSHGLAFCFGWAVAVSLSYAHRQNPRQFIKAALPLLLLLIPFFAYAIYSQKLKHELLGATPPSELALDYSVRRVIWALRDSLTSTNERIFPIIGLFLVLLPWGMGLRIDYKNPSRWVPFAITSLVLMFVPQLAMDTWGLYSRFALFLMPTYAWMFSLPATSGTVRPARRLRLYLGEIMLLTTCIALLMSYGVRVSRFDKEEMDFRDVLAAAKPDKRALSLVYDRASTATHHPNIYAHTPAWYQAEKGGFVDFNFAWHPPQIVRFRVGKTPMIHINFEAHPEQFRWVRDKGDIYQYFFVRGSMPDVDPFAEAPCRPVLLKTSGEWSIYESHPCM